MAKYRPTRRPAAGSVFRPLPAAASFATHADALRARTPPSGPRLRAGGVRSHRPAVRSDQHRALRRLRLALAPPGRDAGEVVAAARHPGSGDRQRGPGRGHPAAESDRHHHGGGFLGADVAAGQSPARATPAAGGRRPASAIARRVVRRGDGGVRPSQHGVVAGCARRNEPRAAAGRSCRDPRFLAAPRLAARTVSSLLCIACSPAWPVWSAANARAMRISPSRSRAFPAARP